MLQRFDITVAAQGAKTSVFASRRGIVTVKLLMKTPERVAVLATPLPGFDPAKDYLVTQTVDSAGDTTTTVLHGKLDQKVIDSGQVSSVGELIANEAKVVNDNVTRFI